MEKEFEPINYVITASVHEATDDEITEISEAALGFMVASNSYEQHVKPFGPDGKPRMLVISAWMAHEGRNLNGDAFVKEELKEVVNQGLFSPPFAGMIDDDHAFTARGYWYKTSFAYDDTAKRWGVIANGAIWAWRYGELADRLLKAMKSKGQIDVSMSVIPGHREMTLAYPGSKGERTNILHNPVFFTTSLLSVPPGDKHARGRAVENPNTEQLKEMAMASNLTDLKVQNPEITDQPQDWQIQSLIFPKTHWERADICKAWAENHGYNVDRYTETQGAFIIHHKDPSVFVAGSFKTQCLLGADRDQPYHSMCRIKAVLGNRKPNPLDENNRTQL
jgi:hypothetical protein